jgi:hypothetical protein
MRFSFNNLMSVIYKVNCTIKIQRWWRNMRIKLQKNRETIHDIVIR